MEWSLVSEEDNDYFGDLEDKEVANGDNLEEDNSRSLKKVVSARRAIEILKEQKQLEADTWDCFQ